MHSGNGIGPPASRYLGKISAPQTDILSKTVRKCYHISTLPHCHFHTSNILRTFAASNPKKK